MKNEILPIQPGVAVHVRDGAPKPPDRFHKKLAEWKHRNYDAVVIGEEPACKYRAYPVYRVQEINHINGYLRIMRDAKPEHVVEIAGAKRYEIKGEGINAIVKEGQ